MNCQVLNPLRQANWDQQLASTPGASIFHTSAWAGVLHQTYRFEPAYFTRFEGGRLAALFPLAQARSLFTGTRGIGLPFTDECPPLGGSRLGFPDLFAAAVDHGRAHHWRYLEWRGGERLLPEAVPSLGFYGHRLDLSPGEKALFDQLTNSTRRAIRKAQQAGLRVDISQTKAAVDAYYALHCRTRQRHGLPPQPYRFFLHICHHLLSKGLGMAVCASHGGKPIAAAVFLHFGEHAVYKFGASDYRFQELRANDLVMWEAIQALAKKGLLTLDFGRTSLAHEGLRRFKLGWGAREYNLEYFKYDLRQAAFVTEHDRVSGWYNAFFRRLPRPWSRLAGRLLYRHMA